MPKTIALDLDDTLVDTIATLLEWIEESRGYRVDEARLASYQLGVDETQTIEIVNGFYDAQAHHKIAAVAGASDACRSLRGAGFELVVVTARKPEVAALTDALVERLFPGVFAAVHAVGHQSDKVKTLRAVGAKLLIDDNVRQIKRAADAGVPTILFGDLPWNRGVAWPRRARTWMDVVAMSEAF
jgi:phosphoglycolate phosphatase-like HAD superfamily hydrolase